MERGGELEMGAQNRTFRRRYGIVCIVMANVACEPMIVAQSVRAHEASKWNVKRTGLQLVLNPEELVITPKLSKFWTFTAGARQLRIPLLERVCPRQYRFRRLSLS